VLHTSSEALHTLTGDGWLLFATRSLRLFAYGALSVVLVFYLVSLGLTATQTGLLLTLTLVGDTLISLLLTTHADRVGRRRTLITGAALMTIAGVVLASSSNFWILVIAGTVGVISPSGQEVGGTVSLCRTPSAAAGITEVARTTGASISPFLVGLMFANADWISVPFFIAGSVKIAYDLLLYRLFAAGDRAR
jgi:MFS family permease